MSKYGSCGQEVKAMRRSSRRRVAIPMEMRKRAGLPPGTEGVFEFHGTAVRILPMRPSFKPVAEIKRLELLESLAEGERAFLEGRSSTHEEAKARMAKRWG
jgi:bifunctional DNA-binding transcriptional regulator/antitoxin component of YhaV-PrlF toxin-antitoxin module